MTERFCFDDTPKQVFQHYKELESVGLAAPQVPLMCTKAPGKEKRGWDIDTTATTVEEAKKPFFWQSKKRGKDMLRDIALGQYYPSDSVIHRKWIPASNCLGRSYLLFHCFCFRRSGIYVVLTLFLAAVIMILKSAVFFLWSKS